MTKNSSKVNGILVVDLECSCWLGHPPKGMRQEIIEVGLCVLEPIEKAIIHRQNIIVKPANSDISEFCNEITGLTNEVVNGADAVPFNVAYDMIRGVIEVYGATTMASWGSNDRGFMKLDCEFHGKDYPFPQEGLNVQKAFKKKMKLKQDVTVNKAVELLGLTFEGKQHRAGDDAHNTAIILSHVI